MNATGATLASAELFDPATNQWTPRASLTDARVYHTATLLPSGQVLVVGGDGPIGEGSAPLASVELFNPAANTWTSRASLTDARESHTATLLPSGQILVVGGMNATGAPLASAELFDPATNQWTSRASLTDARGFHTATRLLSGQVLVVGGGERFTGTLASAELFEPAANKWTKLATGLTDARGSHTATLLQNGQVLVVGGFGASVVLDSAELLDLSLL
jgi:N-acetylneuraminic acid mutarotase